MLGSSFFKFENRFRNIKYFTCDFSFLIFFWIIQITRTKRTASFSKVHYTGIRYLEQCHLHFFKLETCFYHNLLIIICSRVNSYFGFHPTFSVGNILASYSGTSFEIRREVILTLTLSNISLLLNYTDR